MVRKIFWLILVAVILSCYSMSMAASSQDSKDTELISKGTPIAEALRTVGRQFGVTIIFDPTLKGLASGEVDSKSSVEEALKQLLDPIGYFFTKVDNYYLVGGPSSPFTIFADAESSLVPVGFLDKNQQSRLEEYRQYIVYDQKSGAVFIKAPTSMMNKILSDLWSSTKISEQINVVYSFRMVDLSYRSDFDLFFNGQYSNTSTDKYQYIVNAEEISRRDGWSAIISKNIGELMVSTTRQPWVSILPGKTMKLETTYHYATNRKDLLDRKISLEITPLQVDIKTGKVISRIAISQGEPWRGTSHKTSQFSTTLTSESSRPEVIAMVRYVERKDVNGFLGKRQTQEIRDYAIIVNVYPLRTQIDPKSGGQLVSIGDFQGLENLFDENKTTDKQDQWKDHRYINVGIGVDDDSANPWLSLQYQINDRIGLGMDYVDQENYQFGISNKIFRFDPFAVDVALGKSVGTEDGKAVLLGFSDETNLTQYLQLFAKCYPFVYNLDEQKTIKDPVWYLGARIASDQLGISCTASGDSELEGWNFKLFYSWDKYLLLIGEDTTDEEPHYFMGVGYKL